MINNGVINLEATRDSVFVPNRLTNTPSDKEGSEDNNRDRRVLLARKKSIYRGKRVRFSNEQGRAIGGDLSIKNLVRN